MKSFVRGSQIFFHSMKMLSQSLKSVSFFNLFIFTPAWFLLRSWQKIKLTDFIYFIFYKYARLKLYISNHFFQGKISNISIFSFKQKTFINGTIIEYIDLIENSDVGSRLEKYSIWLRSDLIYELLIISIFSVILPILFFSIKGASIIKKEKLRGNDLIKPKSLKTLLKKFDRASDIIIGDVPLVKNSETQHILISGSTGSGKSNLVHELIPQIKERGDRAIIIDMNGTYYQNFFNPEKDTLLNPFHNNSKKWSPWADIKNDYDYNSIADTIIGKELKSNDPFWENGAKEILAEALRLTQNKQNITQLLNSIARSSLEEFHNFFKNSNVAGLTDKDNEKTTLSLRAQLVQKLNNLRCLEDREKGKYFSIQDFITDENNESWLYISLLPSQRESLQTLISCWIELALKGLMRKNPNDINKKTWFLIDELPALGDIPSLKTGLAESRKYGGCLVCGIQNVNQLMSIYGYQGGLNMIDQFATRYIFRSGAAETAELASKMLGGIEIKEKQESLTYGANTVRDGVSLNEIEKKKELVTASEIISLKNLECFVRLTEAFPISKLNMKYNNVKPINSFFI